MLISYCKSMSLITNVEIKFRSDYRSSIKIQLMLEECMK